jgi:hypothetical protein
MEKLSKAEEVRIAAAVERAVRMSAAGMDSTEALRKVATEEKFQPQIVKRAAEAMNISRTLSHLKSAKAEDRAADFPLVDAMKVIDSMYPREVIAPAYKQAAEYVPSVYRSKEKTDFQEKSKPKEDSPKPIKKKWLDDITKESADKRNFALLRDAKEHLRVKESEYRIAFNKTMDSAKDLGMYFRMNGGFDEVEKRAFGQYGQVGKATMDMIYQWGSLGELRHPVKRASLEDRETWLIWDSNKEPMKAIDRLVEAGETIFVKGAEVVDAETAVKRAEEAIGVRPFAKASSENTKLSDEVLEKDAFDPATMSLLPAALSEESPLYMGRALDLREPLGFDKYREALGDAYDPHHQADVDTIRAKAMLNDFISNDPVLSSYDPELVADAYNQVAAFAPQASRQSAVMRGLLRKTLQQGGVIEPFEVQQISQIENSLKGSPRARVSDSPAYVGKMGK